MPNTIKYSTTGDTLSLEKGNFFIGVGDVPKGPTSTTGHWQGITPPISGYTIYANKASEGPSIMVVENDAKLVEFTNGFSAQEFNYISNGGNFTDGTISPFISSYNGSGGVSTVVPLLNDIPYVGTQSKNALYLNYNGGRMMYTDNLLTTGVTYTFSFWAKIISGTTMTISWNNQNGLGETNAWTSSAILTTQWARYSQTFVYNLPRTRFYFNTSNPSNPERAAIFTEFKVTTGSTYGGPGLQNATESLRWFGAVPQDKICVNRDYETIVTDGLLLNLDAGYTPSYPRTGTTSYNLGYTNQNGALVNGPTYDSDMGGSWLFDGVNDNITVSTGFTELNFTGFSPYTIEVYCKFDKILGGWPRIIDKESSEMGSGRDGYNFLVTKVNAPSGYTYLSHERWASASPGGGGNFLKQDDLLLNVWNQFAATFVSPFSATTNLKIYNNGSLATTRNSQGGSLSNTRRPLYFMGGGGPNSGKAAIIRIYNRALSDSEILQNYIVTLPRILGENIITNGLVNYFDAKFMGSYPTSGTTWYDISGYGRNGTLTNGPTYSGGTLIFDGIDDYIQLGDVLDLGTNNLTINMWVKLASSPSENMYIFSKAKAAFQAYRYGFRINQNKIAAFFQGNLSGSDIAPVGNTVLTVDTWYMVTIVFNRSSDITLYVNGIQETLTGNNTISQWNNLNFQSDNPTRIGSYTSADNTSPLFPFKGSISIVQVYFKTLTQSEISQNFNAQKSRFGL
jgi:hypothetical protein